MKLAIDPVEIHTHKHCPHHCRCAAPRAWACQKCSRDRHRAEEAQRNERNRQQQVAGR